VDELGPESAKSYRGKRLLPPPADEAAPAPRATQEIDYGRRGSGYVFGAFRPATGDALTRPYDRRTTANFVDFLTAIDRWLAPQGAPVYLILDNLSTHHAPDVLLFAARHPAWTFVYQPVYAAWLNLIEPWWKTLRSLALKGRRFASWEDICEAIDRATTYWNAHKHPFVWGRRRRHRPRRKPGIAVGANVRPT
jgi:transposase